MPEASPTAKLHAGAVPAARLTERDDLPQGDVIERLMVLFERIENGMQSLADELGAAVPSWIFEWGYLASGTIVSSTSANNSTGSISTLSAMTSDLEYITNVVSVVPAGATGTITLGSAVVPVGPGVTCLPDVRFPLFESDLRSLLITSSGALGLYLFGQCGPTRGKLPL